MRPEKAAQAGARPSAYLASQLAMGLQIWRALLYAISSVRHVRAE